MTFNRHSHQPNKNHRRVWCVNAFLLSLVLLAIHGAHPVQASSGSALSASSNNTASDANDSCNDPVHANGCVIGVTCSACLFRAGCSVEASTGKCVSTSRIIGNVGMEYFTSGSAAYCLDGDDACASCGAQSAKGSVCRGTSGCICIRACEVAPIQIINCTKSQGTDPIYILIALAIFAPVAVFVRMQKKLTAANLTTTRSYFMRRDRHEAEHQANPLTMKLDGWRSHMEHDKKEQPSKIELQRCARDVALSLEEGRKTDDCDAYSSFTGSDHGGDCGASRTSSLRYEDTEMTNDDGHQYEEASTPRAAGDVANRA